MICNKCKKEKVISEYRKHYTNKNGDIVYNKICNQCISEYNKIYRPKEYQKQQQLKEKILKDFDYSKTKKCNYCYKEKTLNNFLFERVKKDNSISFNSICNDCRLIYNKKLDKKRRLNPEWVKKENERRRKFREEHLDKVKEFDRKNYENRKEAKRKRYLEYKKENPDKCSLINRKAAKKYNKKMYGNPLYRLNKLMSSAISKNLKNNKNGKHWEDIVGYKLQDLKKHLESRFQHGMSWDNYGEWHIDHKTPKSWFVFESYNDIGFKECWKLENLQPLWAKDNISKGNRHAD